MKKLILGGLSTALVLAVSVPSFAAAEDPPDPSTYQVTSTFSLEPRSGSFFNNAFKAANWEIVNTTSATRPPNDIILPTRNVKLKLPPSSQLTFNPPSSGPGSAICPDNQIGPDTNNSAEIPDIVAKCPNSVIGNGTAKFALAKNNINPALSRNGVVVAFNGGRVNGEARVKFWAYSYETTTGVYTEGVLKPDGTLDLPFPVLTLDSGLTDLTASIPGRTRQIRYEQLDRTITLPGGQALNYVQAKCDTGTFPYSADFLLGQRTDDGEPFGPVLEIDDVGSGINCTGIRATPRLGKVTVKGPARAKRNKPVTFTVTIPNAGGAAATGVRLAAAGRGVRLNSTVGTIAGEGRKTVKVKAKFKKKGKVKATFNVTSNNAGRQKATKTITVR